MRGLEHFSIQLSSLKEGESQYTFDVDADFFSHFEASPLRDAEFTIDVTLIRSRKTIEGKIQGNGDFATQCDRCTAKILMPQEFESFVLIQIADQHDDDDIETYYIKEAEHKLDLAPLIYNEIILHMPMLNIYDCENDSPKPCDLDILSKLRKIQSDPEQEASPWSSLKDLNLES